MSQLSQIDICFTFIKKCFIAFGIIIFSSFFNYLFSQTDSIVNPAVIDSAISSPVDTTKITDLSKALADSIAKPVVAIDSTKKNGSKKMIDASFLFSEIELKKGEIASNVLKVVNNDKKAYSFVVEVSHPHDWRSLTNSSKVYRLEPSSDTLYIPIRIIPPAILVGNTKFLINVFLLSEEENKQVSGAFFFAGTKKVVKWDLSIFPREKIYFKNDERSAAFGYNILNVGNETQDILLSMSEVGKNLIISDSSGKVLTKRYFDFTLEPTKDTSIHLNMRYYEGNRNFRRTDIESYIPKSSDDEKKFTLFLKSTESKQASKSRYSNGKKISFIKLSNRKKVNPYSSAVIPLIMDANAFNIMGNQPIMNLVLRGNTYLANEANLVYYSQIIYSSYSYNSSFIRNSFGYLGYFDKKFDVQLGNVNGGGVIGLPVIGKGIRGNYYINDKHTVGAFFTRAPYLFGGATTTSIGLSHKFILSKGKQISSAYGRIINTLAKRNTDFLTARISYALNKKHQLGFSATGTRHENTAVAGAPVINFGYLLNANYSGRYFKEKLVSNVRATYNSNNFGTTFGNRFQIMHRSTYYQSKKYTFMLQNNLNTYQMPFTQNGITNQINNLTFTNQLFLSRNSNNIRVMPSLFYNVFKMFNTRLHYRGIGLDYNYFNNETNFRISASLRGGYNDLIDHPEIKEYFSLSFFGMTQYHNFSMNVRYNYGPQAARNVTYVLSQQEYPQLFYTSLQHQYVFKDVRFILQSNINYSYINQLYSHSFGFNPEIYFFSYNGWRLRFGIGYNASSTNRGNVGLYSTPIPTTATENKGRNFSQNFNMSVGVRKEFGIPIPKKWAKEFFHTATFITFMDVNGNKIKDKNEIALENVVVSIGEDNEVLTNPNGNAVLQNIKQGYYKITAISLTDLKGWFPYIPDSISIDMSKEYYIPYVKGVKLYGNVLVDRDKYVDNVSPIDISRIRITATDSTGKAITTLTDSKGTYVLYVPFGKYTLTMDEGVLGDGFTLAQNNIEVELREGLDNLYNTFYVVEKRRKINKKVFKNGDQ